MIMIIIMIIMIKITIVNGSASTESKREAFADQQRAAPNYDLRSSPNGGKKILRGPWPPGALLRRPGPTRMATLVISLKHQWGNGSEIASIMFDSN